MKTLITGSNGLLGQKLVKLLTENNEPVIATSLGKNRLHKILTGYTYQSLDITNEKQVREVLTHFRPEVVIHTAAKTNVDQCELEQEACDQLNVKAVEYLVSSCSQINAHFVHLSTDFIFDGRRGPLDENAIPNPISHYGRSKLQAEEFLQKSDINWSIIRTVLVYGVAYDMSRSNIVLRVKNSLEAGKTIQVVNDQWRTPTLAEDLAMGCYLVAQNGRTGIYNISGEELMTPYEMAIKTAEFFKLDQELIKETDVSKFTQPAKRPPRTGFIIEKAKIQLGYQPHSFEAGLKVLKSQLALT